MESLTISEFRERFGTATERRRELCARFEEWLTVAAGTGLLRKVWVYGSFVSAKLDPADIDVLAVMAQSFSPGALPQSKRFWFALDTLNSVEEIHLALFSDILPAAFFADLLEWFAGSRMDSVPGLEIIL